PAFPYTTLFRSLAKLRRIDFPAGRAEAPDVNAEASEGGDGALERILAPRRVRRAPVFMPPAMHADLMAGRLNAPDHIRVHLAVQPLDEIGDFRSVEDAEKIGQNFERGMLPARPHDGGQAALQLRRLPHVVKGDTVGGTLAVRAPALCLCQHLALNRLPAVWLVEFDPETAKMLDFRLDPVAAARVGAGLDPGAGRRSGQEQISRLHRHILG